MAMSQPSSTVLQQRWAFCMRSMVFNVPFNKPWPGPNPFIGAGALVAPLIATQFAELPRWSFHFLTSLGISVVNVALLIVVFRFKTQDGEWDTWRRCEVLTSTFRMPRESRTTCWHSNVDYSGQQDEAHIQAERSSFVGYLYLSLHWCGGHPRRYVYVLSGPYYYHLLNFPRLDCNLYQECAGRRSWIRLYLVRLLWW